MTFDVGGFINAFVISSLMRDELKRKWRLFLTAQKSDHEIRIWIVFMKSPSNFHKSLYMACTKRKLFWSWQLNNFYKLLMVSFMPFSCFYRSSRTSASYLLAHCNNISFYPIKRRWKIVIYSLFYVRRVCA